MRNPTLSDTSSLSAPLCDAVRNVLSGEDPAGVTLTTRAAGALDDIRGSFAWARRGRTAVVDDDGGLTWWTFAGLHANAGLMAAMGVVSAGL